MNNIYSNETIDSPLEDGKYHGKRGNDVKCERLCAAYADRYLFSRLHYTVERVDGRDEESVLRQKRGEDVVLRDGDGNVKCVIDEKAKLQGHLNDVITFPSFEIIRRPAEGALHSLGWFAHPVSNTTHYAMISLASNRDVPKGREHLLDMDDITCMVYALIDKKALAEWVVRETFRSINEIADEARELFNEWNSSYKRQDWGVVKPFREDWRGKYIYLKLSATLDNQPVNLVVRRDHLRKAGLIREIYVDANGIRKYEPPDVFCPLGEKLVAI